MKILMVSRWLWEERRRNGNKIGFFGELAQALIAKGIHLTILSQASGAGPVPERRPLDGQNIHVFSRTGRVPLLMPPDKMIKLWSGYRKAATDASAIRRFNGQHGPFDAILAQCEEPDGLACAIASLPGGLPPLITAVHDLRYNFGGDNIRFTRKSALSFVFRKSARVVANSTQTAMWLEREYNVPKDKIGQARIHLTGPFLEEANKSKPAEPTDQRILFLGALNRKKGPDVFLQAAIKLALDLPGAKFVVVGPQTENDETFHIMIEELAAQLGSRLEMPGRIDTAAVIDQIRRARVVVCPSRIETFSRTTIEALALGRPVIVTETTGAAHWVESTGCGAVVPPNDPAALARAIRDWAARDKVPAASATITSELTAARAADDWLRELTAIVPVPSS